MIALLGPGPAVALVLGTMAMLCAIELWHRPAASRGSIELRGVHPVATAVPLLLAGAWWLRSVLLLIAVPFVWFVVAGMLRRHGVRRQRNRVDASIVAFTEDLSQQLRGGWALASSFVSTVERHQHVGDLLAPALAAVKAGVRLETALDQLAEPPGTRPDKPSASQGDRSLRLLAASVAVLTENGGPAAASLERLAETLREASSARAEAQAQASQAVASAAVLAALPLLFVAGYAVVDRDVISFYLRTTLGGFCVMTMLCLTAAGLAWIEAIVGRER